MSIKVKTLPVGQLAANCYLVFDENTRQTLLIDPGDDADYISQSIRELELIPQQIVATHGHFDHIIAVNHLKLTFDIPFSVHQEDEFLVQRIKETAHHFLLVDPGPAPQVDSYLSDDQSLELGSHIFEVIHTPGHSPGGVSIYHQQSHQLFVGDTIFANGGIGRYDFSYCSYPDLKQSISQILSLPGETLIYPGHGSSSIVNHEKKFHQH